MTSNWQRIGYCGPVTLLNEIAAYLNTSPSTVQTWERGEKKPDGPSLKLLNLVERKGLEVLG